MSDFAHAASAVADLPSIIIPPPMPVPSVTIIMLLYFSPGAKLRLAQCRAVCVIVYRYGQTYVFFQLSGKVNIFKRKVYGVDYTVSYKPGVPTPTDFTG